MPLPNNYEIGDGLNTAGYRWVRALIAAATRASSHSAEPASRRRKQINVKLDHNFNAMHKVRGTYTYERSAGGANLMTWPDTFAGSRYRHPQHLSVAFTSTLSPSHRQRSPRRAAAHRIYTAECA